MFILDQSFESPAENLAADEALLDAAEAGTIGPTLRFWVSPIYFVALGYTNRVQVEANVEACLADGIPLLRRVSGGGTVLQGPGCLNYAVIHPVDAGEPLNIGATNCFVMTRQREALSNALGQPVDIAGHTDLALGQFKFSGNAQRRRSKYFLFHGTILLNLDLEAVHNYLRPPSREPEYRAGRTHKNFITNLPMSQESAKSAIAEVWGAHSPLHWDAELAISPLIAEKYSRHDWNFRF